MTEVEINFIETFYETEKLVIKDQITLQNGELVGDIVNSIILKNKIPVYAQKQFGQFVRKRVEEEQHKQHAKLVDGALDRILLASSVDHISEEVKSRYETTWNRYQLPQPQTDAEIFGSAYLRLVDSGTEAMESIARLELQFSRALSEKVGQRDMVLANLDERHQSAIRDLESGVGSLNSADPTAATTALSAGGSGLKRSADINRLEQAYHRDRLQTEINWTSDITALREHQRRDFREYVMEASSAMLLQTGSADSTADDSGSNDGSKPSAAPGAASGAVTAVACSSSVTADGDGRSQHKPQTQSQQPKMSFSTIFANKVRKSASGAGLFGSFQRRLNPGGLEDPVSMMATTSSLGPRTYHPVADHSAISAVPCSPGPVVWQESFTIQLGRQLRSSHNMRILATDPFRLLALSSSSSSLSTDLFQAAVTAASPATSGSDSDHCAETIASRLNTALSLYSHNLSAMVLLVDNRLSTFTGNKKKFADLCERGTDFHFPQLEYQLEEIKRTLASLKTESAMTKMGGDSLEVGDVYVTRHSNLNVVTVVFHLVIDESTVQHDIRFPSPVHCAVRNILRTCFLHDIYCLSLPLLMSHYLKEYMSPAWCTRRVETVLKAVKGALMELCTWKGGESRTVQFTVPPQLPHHQLVEFSGLLTDYFQPYRAVR